MAGVHSVPGKSVGEDGKGAAPGAVDDASGTAVALEACRVLASMSFPATLVFVAYDGEEQGLIGSAAHAPFISAAGPSLMGMDNWQQIVNPRDLGKLFDTIDYAVGIDGKVTRSIASVADELGNCLADAVRGTTFDPKVVLGKKIAL